MPFDIDLRLTPDVRAPQLARRSLEALRSSLDGSIVDEAILLVSELVTNSVRHGELGPADTVAVRIVTAGPALRIEVTDPGPGFDPSRVPPPNGRGGWGLWLLDRIAPRWGVSRDDGLSVWFELDPVSRGGRTGRTPQAGSEEVLDG
jgi:anti-sigma regulatory factor (Ser/Thr protein kinase)